MAQPALATPDLDVQHHPRVGKLAHRLLRAMAGDSNTNPSEQWALVTEVLNFAANAEQRIVEQKRRISYLESLATTDELTGLANRRGFEDFLYRCLAAARRHDEKGILAFIDLDGFKLINDRLGHSAGDAVLCRVGSLLRKQIRKSDFIARLGGDEFVVMLVRSDLEQGMIRAQRIQQQLNESMAYYQGRKIPIQASLGIETYGPDSTAEELLKKADAAMYCDKSRRAAFVK